MTHFSKPRSSRRGQWNIDFSRYRRRPRIQLPRNAAPMVGGLDFDAFHLHDDHEDRVNEALIPWDEEINEEMRDDEAEQEFQPYQENVLLLYKESKITLTEATRLIANFRSRHNLSDKCFAHLLRMLNQAILPPNNRLPASVKYFNKLMRQHSDLVVKYQDETCVIFDMLYQVQKILAGNWNVFCSHKTEVNNNLESGYRDYCGDNLRENGGTSRNKINLSMYTDSAQITKSTNNKVTALILTILDLPPKVQQSVSNVIWAAISVGECKVEWNEIFARLQPQFTTMLNDGVQIELNRPRTLQVKIIEFVADSMARNELLCMKIPSGYNTCPICKIKGERLKLLGDKTTIFPANEAIVLRDCWPNPNANLNGIKSASPLIGLMSLPRAIQCDEMHAIFIGVFKQCMEALYESGKESKILFGRIGLHILQPLEFRRNCRNISKCKKFKANEWRIYCLYLAPLIIPKAAVLSPKHELMVVSLLLLCVATSALHVKLLADEHIEFADTLYKNWHMNLAEAFDRSYLLSKAHAMRHIALLAKLHGSPGIHNAFFGESMMGFVGKLPTCNSVALKQIVERLIAKRHAEDVIDVQLIRGISTMEKRPNANCYEYTINAIANEEIADFLRTHFENIPLKIAREIKIDHFVIQSRRMTNDWRNSIVYFTEEGIINSKILTPCVVEVLVNAGNEEFMLIRRLEKIAQLRKCFGWVEVLEWIDAPMKYCPLNKENIARQETTRRRNKARNWKELLSDSLAFQHSYSILKEELENGKLAVIKKHSVATKGFIVERYAKSEEEISDDEETDGDIMDWDAICMDNVGSNDGAASTSQRAGGRAAFAEDHRYAEQAVVQSERDFFIFAQGTFAHS